MLQDLQEPTTEADRFIRYFSTTMLQNPSAEAMPTTVPGTTRRDCWIIVPGSAGWLVLRMLIGIRAFTAGMTASSLKTPKPA